MTAFESRTAKATAAAAAAGTADVQARRREVALALGMTEPVARHFGETGLVRVGGKPLVLHPLQASAEGPWLASTRAARPDDVSEDAWSEALLLANMHSMLVTHAAFGLAEDGDAVLVKRIPSTLSESDLLAIELASLLSLANAVAEGVRGAYPGTTSARTLQ